MYRSRYFYAAALIAVWMIGALLSHIFVLGYGWFFVDALAIFVLPCLYLFLTRTQSGGDGSDGATRVKTI
jgi:hypothetical protein